MLSNHLILCHSLFPMPSIFPSIRVFSSELALRIRWPKYRSFNFSISSSSKYLRLISFRIDCFDLLAAQGTLKSLLQYHSLKVSILHFSAFFLVQLFHPYMTTENLTDTKVEIVCVAHAYLCNYWGSQSICLIFTHSLLDFIIRQTQKYKLILHRWLFDLHVGMIIFSQVYCNLLSHFLPFLDWGNCSNLLKNTQFSSTAQSCPTLCYPMDCSTPGLPVHHQLAEFTQTHVHWVSDAIQPSHPLSSPSPPTFNPA